MFSFETFKDKRYWIPLPPFIVIFVVISIFSSNLYVKNPIIVLILLLLNTILFWVTYHSWEYIGEGRVQYRNFHRST